MTTDPLFRMTVADVFTIRGRGTVATGQIESGTLKVGDEVEITPPAGGSHKAVVAALEMFRKQLSEAGAGDNVGVLFRSVGKNDVQRGDILTGSSSEFTWKP